MPKIDDIIVVDGYAQGIVKDGETYYFNDISIPPVPQEGRWILVLYPDGPRWLELEEAN